MCDMKTGKPDKRYDARTITPINLTFGGGISQLLPANLSRVELVLVAYNASDPGDYEIRVGPRIAGNVVPFCVLSRYFNTYKFSERELHQLVKGEIWAVTDQAVGGSLGGAEVVEY